MNQYKPEGTLLSTKQNREYLSSPDTLMRARDRGVILEAVAVLCDHNFNLHIELGCGLEAVIPREECQYLSAGEEMKDIAILTRVGRPVCFKVIGLERRRGGESVVILSRKEAQRECYESYVSRLTLGDVIPARVTHLATFGAFLDVGCGITSLMSIDSISVSRISHPAERMSVGDDIYAVVKSTDERGRLSVSQKELLGTWEENASAFREGETVRGVVRSVESYGIFVELTPNLAGLAEYREDTYRGQTAAVFIKSIIPEKMKIKLIIIDSQDSVLYPEPPEYYIDVSRVRHIDAWQYSPRSCRRIIETVF